MFYRLILAHLVGDFVLQTRGLVVRKRTPSGLAIHVILVGLAMLPMAWDRLAVWWPWLLVILAAHGAIDWAKICLEPHLRLRPILPFLVDQVYLWPIYGGAVRREFERGVVVAKCDSRPRTIDLGGTYDHLIGTQDANANNGQKGVTSVTMNAAQPDARFLIKP